MLKPIQIIQQTKRYYINFFKESCTHMNQLSYKSYSIERYKIKTIMNS